jgi:AcrR family transcriptional regulator
MRARRRSAAPPRKRPGPAGGPRDTNRKERIRALTEAGLRLFLRRGIELVTIDEITRAARVAKGSFYRYFKDKGALVEALMAPPREALEEAFEACTHGLDTAKDNHDLFLAWQRLGETITQVFEAGPEVVRLYLQENRAPPTPARAAVRQTSESVSRWAIALTEKAHLHGKLKPIPPVLSALTVVGALERLMLAVLTGEYRSDPVELGLALATLVMDGLMEST